jgi:hypothetical protein
MTAEDRCEVMEIPVSMCDHCRNPAGNRRPVEPQVPYGPVFAAKYDGDCIECCSSIWVGESIRARAGQYAHEDCVDES